jgi:hypothetical protein
MSGLRTAFTGALSANSHSMSKITARRLDFEVDKLSNSIVDAATGRVFDTRIIRLYPSNMERLSSGRWQFDWSLEIVGTDREVFALITTENPDVMQGLISISDRSDHVFMNLLESAEFNIGSKKQYAGVAANLLAFACHRSFLNGFEGAVVFLSKTRLIGHYEKFLGAKRIAGNRMLIETDEALRLVQRYNKSF